MRSYEFARKIENGVILETKAFEEAQLPEYQTKYAAGADFFCAEEIKIPSIWKQLLTLIVLETSKFLNKDDVENEKRKFFNPTLVHTGIKANMEEDEVLKIFNRSSNPKKLGLLLANSVGIIDKDYYNNPGNDGEIMFAFYNIKPWDVTIKVGDRIGQGIFEKILKPEQGLRLKETDRTNGFGSTGK